MIYHSEAGCIIAFSIILTYYFPMNTAEYTRIEESIVSKTCTADDIRYLHDSMESHPENTEVRLLYAMGAFTLGINAERENAGSLDAIYLNALTERRDGNTRKALSLIDKAIENHPSEIILKATRIQLLLNIGASEGNRSFTETAINEAAVLPESGTKLEESYAFAARLKAGLYSEFIVCRNHIIDHGLYDTICQPIIAGSTHECDYRTIQEAIKAAPHRWEIKLADEHYHENLEISKSVSISNLRDIREGRTPIIHMDKDYTFTITESEDVLFGDIAFTQNHDIDIEGMYSIENSGTDDDALMIDIDGKAVFIGCIFTHPTSECIFIGAGDAEFTNCVFLRFPHDGIVASDDAKLKVNHTLFTLGGTAITTMSENASIADSQVDRCTNGFASDINGHTVIENCLVKNASGNGFIACSFSSMEISGCKAENVSGSGFLVQDSSSCEIKNSTADKCFHGFTSDGNVRATISGCSTKNCRIGFLTKQNTRGVAISGCMAVESENHGFLFSNAENAEITACTSSRNKQTGIGVLDSSAIIIRSCTAEGNNNGIQIENSKLTIENCTAIKNQKNGIAITKNTEAECVGCYSEGNGTSGLFVTDSAKLNVTSLEASQNGLSGIECSGTAVLKVEKCNLSRNRHGISLFDKAYGSIIDCIISENIFGIRMRHDSEAAITGSELRMNEECGLSLSEKTTVNAEKCHLEGNKAFGIITQNDSAVMLKNSACTGSEFGITSNNGGNYNLISCIFTGHSKAAYHAEGNAIVSIEKCEAKDNQVFGFCFTGESRITMASCIAENCKLTGFALNEKTSGAAVSCASRENGGNGFLIAGNVEYSLKECTAENNDGSGFTLRNSAICGIVSSISRKNKGGGFFVTDDAECSFTDCIAENNESSGFWSENNAGMTIDSCRSCGSKWNGLQSTSSKPVKSINSDFSMNEKNGAAVTNDSEFIRCELKKNVGYGIWYKGSQPFTEDTEIDGNKAGPIHEEPIVKPIGAHFYKME